MNYLVTTLKLYPTKEQETLFRKTIGCCRFIYNHYLFLRKENHARYKQGKKDKRIPTESELKQTYEWLREVDANAVQIARQNLDTAFKNCFKHGFGYPKFHKKGIKETFSIPQKNEGHNLIIKKDKIKLGKCGLVKSKGPLLNKGKIKRATVKLEAGAWYVSILHEIEDSEFYQPQNFKDEACGIDLGVIRPLMVTNGIDFQGCGRHTKAILEQLELRRKRYQRQLARKVKGSRNREKAKIKVQKAFQKERFVRKDFIEQVSDKLTKTFRKIIFEDLKIASMTARGKGKHGLNREMLRLGLSSLVKRTMDKAARRGNEVVFVDPRYTSQTCSSCGTISKESRKSQSRFQCVGCGFKLNADKNASLNILAKGLA